MANFLQRVVNNWRHNKQVRQTVRELRNLTDAELTDIGLGRGDIVSVARGDKDMKMSSRVVFDNRVLPVNPNIKGWV
tara:strand:- start:7881 stop:8111 length:231 start_codon:yes stop_codon:yes gene_type:complete